MTATACVVRLFCNSPLTNFIPFTVPCKNVRKTEHSIHLILSYSIHKKMLQRNIKLGEKDAQCLACFFSNLQKNLGLACNAIQTNDIHTGYCVIFCCCLFLTGNKDSQGFSTQNEFR